MTNQPAQKDVLVVGNTISANSGLVDQLVDLGFQVLLSETGVESIARYEENNIYCVFIDIRLPDMSCSDLISHIKAYPSENYVPIVLLVSDSDSGMLTDCMSAGGDDFLLEGFSPDVLEARIKAIEQIRELRRLYNNSVHEQVIGKQILSAALSARSIEVKGMQVVSYSAAIFTGDLVLSAQNPRGVVHILLADFTGHGLSAAIGVLPVAEMFSVMTEKGFGPETILRNINNKLYTLLPTGMFMAACMLEIDNDLHTSRVWNSGMPDVYLLDQQTGSIKRRFRSTYIPLGINDDIDNSLESEQVEIQPGDHFVLHSDGLTDAIDSSGEMFGVGRLEHLIEGTESVEGVFNTIVSSFNRFCTNQELLDDVTLVVIPCKTDITGSLPHGEINENAKNNNSEGWRLMMELSGSSLHTVNPVPILMDQYMKLGEVLVDSDKLENILAALYENALKHGVLELSHLADTVVDKYNKEKIRNNTMGKFHYGFIRIEIQQIKYQGSVSLLVRLEDSGSGFDHAGVLSDIIDQSNDVTQPYKTGIPMVRDLCQTMNYHGSGSRVEVIVGDHLDQGIQS